MTAGLLIAAAALWVLASVVALTATRTSGMVATAVASAAGGLAALAGGVGLLLRTEPLSAGAPAGALVGTFGLRATALAGAFVALLGLLAFAIAWYAPRYHQAGNGTVLYLLTYNLALLASLGVLVAGTVATFLVAWESMALLSFLMILRHHGRDGVSDAAFWFLALSEIGFLLIVAAFVVMAVQCGSLDLATIAARASTVPLGVRTAVWVLALVGFGFKAGLVPLHVWLPEAHPVAPADGSAFLSGLVVKLGVYGIMLFTFELLGTGPAWWGLATMTMGAATAVIGILYALTERDIKRFLAWSTVENVGVIVTAMGAGMAFNAYAHPELGALLLLAALYHVVNHGAYKGLLFLEAGVVEHATGTRDMDRLGGLVRLLPRSTAISLVGTLGIAALPPLNGFVSEWLIFQGLFQGFRIPSHLAGILVVFAGACLGLSGGLAIAAFVRAFGIPYLGMPRSDAAAQASERGQPVGGPAVLAAVCVALGVGAPVALIGLERAVHTTTGVALGPELLVGNLTVIPAHTDFSGFSPTYLAVFLVAVSAVPLLIYAAGRPRGASAIAPVWDGGILAFRPRMQYTAAAFAAPTRVTFSGLYRPSVRLGRASDDPAGRSGPVHYEADITPVFQRYLYQPVVTAVEWLADLVRPIQSGDVNRYLFYVFGTVVVVYALGQIS